MISGEVIFPLQMTFKHFDTYDLISVYAMFTMFRISSTINLTICVVIIAVVTGAKLFFKNVDKCILLKIFSLVI